MSHSQVRIFPNEIQYFESIRAVIRLFQVDTKSKYLYSQVMNHDIEKQFISSLKQETMLQCNNFSHVMGKYFEIVF